MKDIVDKEITIELIEDSTDSLKLDDSKLVYGILYYYHIILPYYIIILYYHYIIPLSYYTYYYC